jgi:lysyl-tRNA synthetase class 2
MALEDILRDRRAKLNRLKEAGVDPYPARTERNMTVAAARKSFRGLRLFKKNFALAGRVRGLRDQGGVLFLDIEDESGRIQAVLKKKTLQSFSLLKETLDTGDFISVQGPLFKTKKGEISVEVKKASILAKNLRPLPSEHFGIEDEELRLRQRYLDLIMSPHVREMFRKKTRFWASVREFLVKEGFMEVETGVLEAIPGGAEAEPFVTHHNALDEDFYLRISLELPLKKLIVAGYEKVFEIGRIFRNEGIDKEHLQDYTQLEFYWAYRDCQDLMELTERMYKFMIERTMGTLVTKWQNHEINWGKQWPRIDYVSAFKEANGMDPLRASLDELRAKARQLGLATEEGASQGRLIDLIYKKTVRPKLIQPCLLINHPKLISPLAKSHPDHPELTERMQVLACGSELGNGWSELNDPLDQRERFEEQEKARAGGDTEAMHLDEDFLRALEIGMPPTAGFGLSERVFSVLMDKPIRETVFFPLMRPETRD